MRIDLAAEQDFQLGSLRVSPSTRELFAPGMRDVLEPRVMMVLVALVRAGGATVSRDQLIQSCWDGLAVSDDAINRAIGRLRKLAASSGAFAIETITKVGYRLTPADATAPIPAARPIALSRYLLVPAVTLAVLAGVGLSRWSASTPPPPPPETDAGTLELIESGRRAIMEHLPQRQEQGVALLREAVRRAPQSAEAWGALALGYNQTMNRVPHDLQPEAERQADAAIARALALEPDEPMALVARALNQPLFGNWLARDKAEQAALKAAHGVVPPDYHSRFLMFTGQMGEVVPLAEDSIRKEPSALYARVNRLQALWALGRVDEAARDSEDLERLFPGNYLAWFQRYYFLLYTGQLRAARAKFDDRAGWPRDIPADEMENCGRMLDALSDPHGPAADAIIAEYDGLVPKGRGYMENAVRISAALGRNDDAFRYMEMYLLTPVEKLPAQRFAGQKNYGRRTERQTENLFLPPVDRLHSDPRFLALLTRIGLVDYWRKSGTRPDFCDRLRGPCREAGIPERPGATRAS